MVCRVAYWAAWSALGPGERAGPKPGRKTAALRALRGRPVLLLAGPEESLEKGGRGGSEDLISGA